MNVGTEIYKESKVATCFSIVVDREQKVLHREKYEAQAERRDGKRKVFAFPAAWISDSGLFLIPMWHSHVFLHIPFCG